MATQDQKKIDMFSETQDLNDNEREDFNWVKTRIEQLKKTRQNHYGHNLDSLWSDVDKDYIPHRLRTRETRVIATDEDRGWRGALVTLGSSDWQSDLSQSNPFVKVQVALSILIDQNPAGIFTPMQKKFAATSELMRQLYQRSWEMAKSKPQLKLFVFNLAKYGWAVGRTYPLRIERDVKVLTAFDGESNDPKDAVYETKKVVEYNDIFRENLDPRNVWIDDMARPNNPMSVRDWCWRKVYDMDDAEKEFGKYPLWKKVQAGGNIAETVTPSTGTNSGTISKQYQGKNLVEIYFYENRSRDLFHAHANGVPIIMDPLPVSDVRGSKKLSLWQTYWNLRHAESPYGIGVYEAMRYDNAMLDRIRNMTIDQLTLSIYKMFFYQGTQELQNTGEITIVPGVGKPSLNPKNISWMEVPGPGKDAWEGIKMMRGDVDEASGITDPLLGVVTGKTAFEIAQAKETALKRLKTPLENILEALNDEAYITISLAQLLYSIPEVYEVSDPLLIDDYLQEVGNDPQLYERKEETDAEGNTSTKFMAKVYPEFPLNLEEDEEGNLVETQKSRFFRIKPRFLDWEGIINIKSQSILTPSKQLDKALDLEFYNMYIPLISTLDQERVIASQSGQAIGFDDLPHGKAAKALAKLYDKDPRDVLPDPWLKGILAQTQQSQPGQQPTDQQPGEQPLFIKAGQQQVGSQPIQPAATRFMPQVTQPVQSQGVVQRLMARLSEPFRSI